MIEHPVDSDSDTPADVAIAGEGTATPIGVKLGSNRTTIVFREDGARETVQALSCLTVPDNPAASDTRVHYGETAARRFPERTVYVLQSGLPADATSGRQTEQFFDALCTEYDLPADSAVVYAIPSVPDECGLANLSTVVDRSAVGEALTRGFPESLCGSIPALGDGVEAIDQIFVALNLGATTFEACAYRHGDRQAPFSTDDATGRSVDWAIVDAVEDETDGAVTLDRETAREYKETHADFDSYEPFSDTVEHPDGGTHEFTVEHGVMGPLDAYLDDVVDALDTGFFSRLANRHLKTYQLALTRPLVVTGGMACVPGLADELAARLGERLGRDVTVVTPDRPDTAAAEGAYRIAERLVADD
ncbi:hypothetical protein [Haloferax sp. YSMS24]|uniref:hypothetical protein n=1 Tax=Haloferax sp. YSMS24 TaxID=3388425 RepID=UPI00398CF55D